MKFFRIQIDDLKALHFSDFVSVDIVFFENCLVTLDYLLQICIENPDRYQLTLKIDHLKSTLTFLFENEFVCRAILSQLSCNQDNLQVLSVIVDNCHSASRAR